MSATLQIGTLGGLSLKLDGKLVTGLASRKVEAILVYLVCNGRVHPREVLGEFFWEERTQERAMGNLRVALASLRKELGEYVEITRDTAAINPDADIWLDVHELESKLDAGLIADAVELYQGPFLEGFFLREAREFEDWMYQERERIQRRVLDGFNDLVVFDLERGAFRSGIENAHRLLAMDSLNENAHRQMMLLLACSGQRSAALSQYETCRQTLENELGIEPSEGVQEVYEALAAGERPHGIPEVPGVEPQVRVLVGECPYRGLAAFREQDAPFFFGRETFTENLFQAVNSKPLVAVIVGSSGSGKSSTVFAGLLPRLRGADGWQIIQLRPGKEPFQALSAALLPVLEPELSETDRFVESGKMAAALGEMELSLFNLVERVVEKVSDSERLLLVVDQFEELYTLCPDPYVRRSYLDALLGAVETANANRVSPFVLLLTMRADFMGRALAYRPFADALQEASLILGPMNEDELRVAIEKPAEIKGAAFEAGLVERLLDDVGQEPGNLPLLEFALTLLWEKQNYGWMTHEGYEEIGRVEGALASYADKVFAELDEEQQDRAHMIFVQMVRPGVGTEDTRRMAAKVEVGEDSWELVQRLADKRLVVTGHDPSGLETVEVVHEALIQRWDMLRSWIEADRAFRTWQERLRASMSAWEESQRDQGALLRGVPLAEAVGWKTDRGDEISAAESEYIAASSAYQAQRQVDRDRRRRRIMAGLAGGLVVALALAALAWFNWQRADTASELASDRQATAQSASTLAVAQGATAQSNAEARATAQNEAQSQAVRADVAANEALQQKDVAEQEARAAIEAYSLSLAANAQQALDVKDPDTALVLAMAANGIENPPQAAQDILRKAAFSPGARRILVAEEPHILITDVEISPDGLTALTGLENGNLGWWDLEKGQEIQRLKAHSAYVNHVTFSPDGDMAATGGDDGLVIVWDVPSRAEISRFEGHTLPWVTATAFSPDGRMILSGGTLEDGLGGELILWEVETGQEIHRFEEHDRRVWDVAFSPDGSKVYSASDYTPLTEWDSASGQVVRRFEGAHPEESPRYIDVNPDEGTIMSGTWEGVIYIWDLETGELLQSFEEKNPLEDVAFIPNSRLVVSLHQDDGVFIIRDLVAAESLYYFTTQRGEFVDPSIALSPDGRTALTIYGRDRLVLWDLFGADEIRRFEGHTSTVGGLCVTPDGKYLVSGAGTNIIFPFLEEEYTLRFWDLQSGKQVRLLEAHGHTDVLNLYGITSDGRTALTTSFGDNSLWVWDLESGTQTRHLTGHTDWILDAVISPDDRTALSASWDGTLILWDLQTGEILRRLIGHDAETNTVDISPDGRTALSGSMDTTMILWDLETGEQIRRFYGHEQRVMDNAFTPDGRYAVSSGWDNTLILWDVATGEEIRRYTHSDSFRKLVISPDGRQVLAGAMNGPLVLWDIESGEVLHTFYGHNHTSYGLAFSPDGSTAFSGGNDFYISEWQLTSPTMDELLDWVADNRYIRELSCEERELYKIDEHLCEEETSATPTPAASIIDAKITPRSKLTAQVGENRGEIVLGDFDTWYYQGKAGEVLTISMVADNPADDTARDQQVELGLMDTVLFVIGPDGSLIGENNNAAGGVFSSDSLVEGLELPKDGEYRIEARSYLNETAGGYKLLIEVIAFGELSRYSILRVFV